MNFETINSPADLVKANEQNPMEVLINQIDDLGPEAALAVAQLLVDKLHTLHCRMATRDDVSSPLAWAKDAGLLEVAKNILNNIEF
jgi:hypothetical protein